MSTQDHASRPMRFIDRLVRKWPTVKRDVIEPSSIRQKRYVYLGLKIPQKALTPREIEELHAKLYPEKHWADAKLSQDISCQREEERLPYLVSLEEKFSSARAEDEFLKAQSQSLLFCLLPREIRMQIWCSAIGSKRLYLTEKNGCLVQSQKLDSYDWWPKTGLLNVPLTCRAVYMESISYLYSSNILCFGFGHDSSKSPLIQPCAMLPDQHIASIRHIEIGWHLSCGISQYYDSHPQAWDLSLTIPAPEDMETWTKVFMELTKLPNLRSLKIVVWASGHLRSKFIDLEADMLQPLVDMQHVKHFDIFLPWTKNDNLQWKNVPFKISRTFKDRKRFGVNVPILRDKDE